MKQFNSFHARLVLLFGILFLAVSVGLTAYLDRLASATLAKAAGDALYSTGNSAAMLISRTLVEREREIRLLSKSHLLTLGDLQGAEVQQLLNDIRQSYPFYAWIGLAAPDGTVLQATDGMLLKQNVAQRPWFSGGLERSFVGDVHEAVLLARLLPQQNSNEPLRFIDFAAPVHGADNSIRGVVATHVHWGWVHDVLSSVLTADAANSGVELLILGSAGHWLHPYEYIGQLAVPADLPPAGQVALVDWADKQYLTSRIRISTRLGDDLGWQLILRQPAEQALAPVAKLNRQLLWYGAMTLLLAMILAYRLASHFSRPVEQLASLAQKVAQGGENVVFNVSSKLTEIRHLSGALSSMMIKMAAKRQALLQANSTLEQQVATRTADLERANARLQQLSHKDALTGIYNRRAADERLKAEFATAKRSSQRYAVLLMDIDHFKQINDQLGHETGDQVIQQVAKLLDNTIRDSDFVARYGGEEFIAVLPATDLHGAVIIANKLCRDIASLDFATAGRVTISIGVAPSAVDDTDADTVVRKADAAMYEAKRAGRNRVMPQG
ncbi:diguanylate cyclase [Rheinheimera pacifica]|uniref:sensor domain-containing diguanylate cyclase n=1 Tax=Rheinheimera pacifica TaxID=173990 RepID=UPI0028593DDB|nr:diguanylate cyclase [Rheinheimera pacifica]MDR6983689.1 diguanylate cyclase [Rheinheimera pacifica]